MAFCLFALNLGFLNGVFELIYISIAILTVKGWTALSINQISFITPQVKIWFQNRRAKERKMIKKKISQFDGSGGSAQSDSGSLSPNELSNSLFPPPHGINGLQPNDIHQVIVSEWTEGKKTKQEKRKSKNGFLHHCHPPPWKLNFARDHFHLFAFRVLISKQEIWAYNQNILIIAKISGTLCC